MTDGDTDIDVLIVEDEAELAELLADATGAMGYRTRIARTGAQALQVAGESPPSLVLLDLGLPDLDGMSVCRQLLGLRGPRVIVVTAMDDAEVAQAALELGADDYVRKPFFLNELAARVRAVLRRGSTQPSGILKVGRLAIDRDTCMATVDGREVQLTATELRLLTFFAEHPGWVFSTQRLLESLWPNDRETHAVQVHISNLRRKIELDPAHPTLLVTVRGLGYKLEPFHPSQTEGKGVGAPAG